MPVLFHVINHHFHSGAPIAGEIVDPRYHANLAWHGHDPAPAPAFQAWLVVPATLSREWDVTKSLPSQPPVPQAISAWKSKAALREAGLLDVVDTAVKAADGRNLDAWAGAAEWQRDSGFLQALAEELDLSSRKIDQMFREASTIQS